MVRIALGVVSGPTPRMVEASGTHVPSWGWALAAMVGLFLAAWGTIDITFQVVSNLIMRWRLSTGRSTDDLSLRTVSARKAEAVAFLLNMSAHHGHMDVEGVSHAIRDGEPLGDGPCWVCGRSRTASAPPIPIGHLVLD